VSPYVLTLFIYFDFGHYWKLVIGLNIVVYAVIVLVRVKVSSCVFGFSVWKYPVLPVFIFCWL